MSKPNVWVRIYCEKHGDTWGILVGEHGELVCCECDGWELPDIKLRMKEK